MTNGRNAKRQRQKDLRRARIEQQTRARKARRNRTMILVVALLSVAVAGLLIQRSKSSPRQVAGSPKPSVSKVAQSKTPPKISINPAGTYTAVMRTSLGEVQIRLDASNSVNAVNSFVALARNGFYDGLQFHRIVKDFAIQGGDPKGDGSGGPAYKTLDAVPPGFRYVRGTVAMAKAASEPPGTAGSQFFIVPTDSAATRLTPDYAVLGKVVQGLDVVDKLNQVPTKAGIPGGEASKPVNPVYIEKVEIKQS